MESDDFIRGTDMPLRNSAHYFSKFVCVGVCRLENVTVRMYRRGVLYSCVSVSSFSPVVVRRVVIGSMIDRIAPDCFR